MSDSKDDNKGLPIITPTRFGPWKFLFKAYLGERKCIKAFELNRPEINEMVYVNLLDDNGDETQQSRDLADDRLRKHVGSRTGVQGKVLIICCTGAVFAKHSHGFEVVEVIVYVWSFSGSSLVPFLLSFAALLSSVAALAMDFAVFFTRTGFLFSSAIGGLVIFLPTIKAGSSEFIFIIIFLENFLFFF